MNPLKFLPAISALLTLPAFGAISFTGAYSENFDGLPTSNTTLTGTNVVGNHVALPGVPSWEVARLGPATATTNVAINSSYSTGGRFYSMANTTDPSDRAIVALGSGTFWGGFGVALVNDTTDVVTTIRISYSFEIWGVQGTSTANATEDRLAFAYGVSGGGITVGDYLSSSAMVRFEDLDAISPTTNMVTGVASESSPPRSRDGNAPEWRQINSAVIGGLDWTPGQTLFVRFSDSNSAGFDASMGVDDFSIVAIPEPSALVLSSIALAGLLVRRRR
jgi:uncharacterized protein